MKRAVTMLSGGLDSTTLAYQYKEAGYDLVCLSFYYGQRHARELAAAHKIAGLLEAEHHVIRLGVESSDGSAYAPLGSILGGSVLVDHGSVVPDGHYADENMKATVVPNRNAIMLSISYGVAMAKGAEIVAFGAHSGDHQIYPDCRPEFVDALNKAFQVGAAWTDDELSSVPRISAPFLGIDKTEIARRAKTLGVPIAETWSCYKGGNIHCGTCGTCYERREAFRLAGVYDPTQYLDDSTLYDDPTKES